MVHVESGYLHFLRVPELRRATLQIEWNPYAEAAAAFLRNSLPPLGHCKLKYLELHEVRAEDDLAGVFQQLGALEELSLIRSSHASTFCDALATLKDNAWLLPRLCILKMKDHGYCRPPGSIKPSLDIGSAELPMLFMIQ